MDVNQGDVDKYAAIRQTIRSVILPVVQAIYDDNPPDVIQFCSQYFNDLLQKRECEEKFTGDRNAFQDKADQSTTKTSESKSPSSSNIQGSASEPVLASEKLNVGLRETSSWTVPPTYSEAYGSGRQNFDLRDAICSIGDQPGSSVIKPTELEEADVKAEIGEFSNENDDKLYENDDSGCEISPVIKNKLTAEEAMVFPSAPPYEGNDLKEIETNLKTLEVNEERPIDMEMKNKSKSKNEESIERSQSPSNILSSDEYSTPEKNIEGRCNKQISPNSSFGFIPHLKEDDSQEEENITNDFCQDSYFREKSGDIQELAGKFSETFRDLAHQFNSAETKLNDEFQKVREISDIIQGRCQTRDIKNDGTESLDLNEGNEKASREKIADNFYTPDENNNKGENTPENFSECVTEQHSPASNKESNSDIRNAYSLLKEHEIRYGTYESCDEELNLVDSDAVKECSLCQNDKNEEENRRDRFNSRTTVDESWKRKWYEAHLCLDNIRRSVQQITPRLFQSPQATVGNRGRRNPVVHSIGEGGDVPLSRCYNFEEDSARSSACSEPNNKRRNNGNSSAIKNEFHFENNLSADETCKDTNSLKVTPNITGNDSPTAKTSNIPSQNVPYSWRKMTKPQASYLESEKNVLRQIATTFNELKNQRTEDLAITKDEHGTLPEIEEVTRNDKNVENNSPQSQHISSSNGRKGNLNDFKHLGNVKGKTSEGGDAEVEISERSCKANITDEALTASDKNAKTLINEEIYIKGCNNVSEIGEESYLEKMTDSDPKNHLKYEQNCNEPYQSVDERNTELDYLRQTVIMENYEGEAMETKESDCKEIQSEIKDCVDAYHRFNESLKVEPGLNSACGDFTSSVIDENEQGSEQGNRIDRENSQASFHHGEQPADTGVQPITAEYVEEIMEKVIQEQSLSDSYEGLNFSSYSESESSNIESDFSEENDSG